jgi:hypothetical protein
MIIVQLQSEVLHFRLVSERKRRPCTATRVAYTYAANVEGRPMKLVSLRENQTILGKGYATLLEEGHENKCIHGVFRSACFIF